MLFFPPTNLILLQDFYFLEISQAFISFSHLISLVFYFFVAL